MLILHNHNVLYTRRPRETISSLILFAFCLELISLDTDLARHYRCKEEASAQAKRVDLTGNGLDGFAIVRRPPQVQHSSITWSKICNTGVKERQVHEGV